MGKIKIAVYAISKNESSFVDRWVDSMQEADDIYVLDTGSSDDTVSKLKLRNVHVVEKKFDPWRFDVARNASLEMVPMDVDLCVCTDLDEVFEAGWRDLLEEVFLREHPSRIRYLYHWKLNEKDEPLVSFYSDKIHVRKNYMWKYPVHEILVSSHPQVFATADIVLKHYPDPNKSRQDYLPLLQLSVQEDPENDRHLHYLGREYLFYQKWDECISTLHQHLHCKNATWKDERAASMRFMARAYLSKGFFEEGVFWYQQAILEAPYLREGYVELGSFYVQRKDYENAYEVLKKASSIHEKSKSYIQEEFAWNDVFYDLFSLAAFYTKHYDEALEYVEKAIELDSTNLRYQENRSKMVQFVSHESLSDH